MNTQPLSFNPIQYISTQEKQSIANLSISSLLAVAHEPLPQGGNHWSIYLTSETGYVRLDMTPSYTVPATVSPGGSKGILIVSRVDDLRLGTASKTVRLDVREGLKVSDFVDLLVREKRHLYEFNNAGQGCRFWVHHQIGLCWDEGLVVNGVQVEEARSAILVMYPEMVGYSLVVGEYYS
ncbi:hypothetical protein BDV32DRAFT_124456 [Aspergillus pseudonomiae]|uniref:DUF7770 domain-containing protein n=1 Tax=Aspergillus pseudonomiae TaxID=1506151 RepID=A0A5N7DQJ4_9EURO|nr:uncharacterized protein BDV37DRAFT_192998 [Aspergillus pseudonomiae]KAB8259387.1 hypothetical protein BDV32DRAFT_124456 [Aspergillus pseudonomiae]KAE8408309.1 hypothetical protein BDV37DRAFT_192998 [Aspergillus pseudonomiae]